MKKHLVALIRAGRKRQTLRYWTHPRVTAGQAAFVPGLGRVLVTAVEPLSGLAALRRADAAAEGFATLAALRAELAQIYGPRPPAGRTLYRVRFVYPAPQTATARTTQRPRTAQPPKKRRSVQGSGGARGSALHTDAARRRLRDYLARHPLNERRPR